MDSSRGITRSQNLVCFGRRVLLTTNRQMRARLIRHHFPVYAYAITICEMLAPNDIPYGYVDSQTVRAMVLVGERCYIPPTAPQIKALIERCWESSELGPLVWDNHSGYSIFVLQSEPSDRPSFEKISPTIEELLPNGERRNTASTVVGDGKLVE